MDSHQPSHLTLLIYPNIPEYITTIWICTLDLSCEMAAMSACSQESLLFSMKSWFLMPNMIFAKQKSLKPGRKGLCLSPPTLVCVVWEGKAVRLCISYWKRELAFFSEFLLLSLGGGMHGSVSQSCLQALCRAGTSGGEPGLDLQG